jgi:thioredoxin-like negative regulator of GroEL
MGQAVSDSTDYEKQIQADRLLLYGLLDQAESLYTEVLDAEPGNSEAAFGLARVALERGDEQLAHERANLAVRLNPRNDDAQRLAQRLTEILEARRTDGPSQHRPQLGRPSERSSFARNPSMADHRADEAKRNEKK